LRSENESIIFTMNRRTSLFSLIAGVGALLLLSYCSDYKDASGIQGGDIQPDNAWLKQQLTTASSRLNYQKSIELLDSLIYFENKGSKSDISRISIKLAENFRKSVNYQLGIRYARNALNYSHGGNYEDIKAMAYNRLAAIYYEIAHHEGLVSMLDSSFFYASKALAVAQKIDDNHLKANSIIIIGAVYYKQQNYPEAEEMLLQAQEVYNQMQETPDMSLKSNLSRTWIELGRYDEALQMANSYYQQSLEENQIKSVILSLELLADVYNAMGDLKSSNEIKNELNEVIRQNDAAIETLMIRQLLYDHYLKEAQTQMESLAGERIYFFRLSRIMTITLIGLVISTILILVIIRQRNQTNRLQNKLLKTKHLADQLTIDKQKHLLKIKSLETLQLLKEKEEIAKELESKNRFLTEKAMSLVQKNEFITNIANQLASISVNLPENCSTQLARVIKELQKDTDQNFWKEFEVRFGEVHGDFFISLNEKAPDLTPAEKKLAAFLRLNLTTKDIANITYQNPESIKVARSRLRKKLGLSTGENLVSFLDGI